MPDWIVLIKPLPLAGETVIRLRRETLVVLDIIFELLPNQPPLGCSGIKIPATRSVEDYGDLTGKTLLGFCIRLYGATTSQLYEAVCATCEKREGILRKGPASLIDFHAQHDIIELSDGKIRVEFRFSCYPKCHQAGDNGYFLDVALSEDVSQNRITAQYQLPFTFHFIADSPGQCAMPSLAGVKRTARQMEELDELPEVDQRNVRSRLDEPSQGDTDGEPDDHPMRAVNPRDPTQGSRHHHSSPSSPSSPPSPVIPPPQPLQAEGPNYDAIYRSPPSRAAILPRTDGESTPTLTEVNPEQGSITGGTKIWLKGADFPALFPLFARFGTAVVPTTFSAGNLLACHLPPAAAAGIVEVTLSKDPQPNAPEYGTSIATFQYLGDHDLLVPILLSIQEKGYPEFTPTLRTLLTSLNGPQSYRVPEEELRRAGPRDDPIGTGRMEALSCPQAPPNIVYTTTYYNHNHMHAHPSIFYGHPSPMGRHIDWCINLIMADVNGLTAFECTYMKVNLDRVRILRARGVLVAMVDELGRTHLDLQLQPGVFQSFIDIDPETAMGQVGSVTETCSLGDGGGEFTAFGGWFRASSPVGDKESERGESSSQDNDLHDNEATSGIAADSFAGGDEGGQIASALSEIGNSGFALRCPVTRWTVIQDRTCVLTCL